MTDEKALAVLTAALLELSPVQAEVLRRLYGIGDGIKHPVVEVAAALGVSPSTVRRRRDDGLQALRRKVPAGILAGLM